MRYVCLEFWAYDVKRLFEYKYDVRIQQGVISMWLFWSIICGHWITSEWTHTTSRHEKKTTEQIELRIMNSEYCCRQWSREQWCPANNTHNHLKKRTAHSACRFFSIQFDLRGMETIEIFQPLNSVLHLSPHHCVACRRIFEIAFEYSVLWFRALNTDRWI